MSAISHDLDRDGICRRCKRALADLSHATLTQPGDPS